MLRRFFCLLTVLLLLPAVVLADTTDVSPLPWDDSAGYEPNPAEFTETGYYDESIHVEIAKAHYEDANFFVANVKIKHASQLRTGLATSLGSKTNKITTMAKSFNSVVAINGDYYSDRDVGLEIRQGVTLRDKSTNLYDVLLIDTDGNFHIVRRDNLDMLDFYLAGALTIQNAFAFGPALVIDGEMQTIPEKYSFAPHYKNPRAAIGQIGELEYVLVVVDGRSSTSDGVTLETLADYMANTLHCTQAYNLDGGGSATLVLGDSIYNAKSSSNERSVSDILYFATSVDPINW